MILEGGERARGSLGVRTSARSMSETSRRAPSGLAAEILRPSTCAHARVEPRGASRAAAPARMARASGSPDRSASLRRLPAPAPDVGIGTGGVPGNSVRSRAGERSGREGERARQGPQLRAGGRDGGSGARAHRRHRRTRQPAGRRAAHRTASVRRCQHLPAPEEDG